MPQRPAGQACGGIGKDDPPRPLARSKTLGRPGLKRGSNNAMDTIQPTIPAQSSASSRRWWVLAIVGIAELMIVLDTTIVNIALPSAQHALGFANSDREWIVTPWRARPASSSSAVPGWAAASAALSLVVMIGGWLAAEALQPPSYSPVRSTISGLAGLAEQTAGS